MMRNNALRVMRNDIRAALDQANRSRFDDSPNIQEVRELLDDALVEVNIELSKTD